MNTFSSIEQPNFKDGIGYKLSRAAQVLQKSADGVLKPYGLTRLSFCVLSALQGTSGRAPSDLAEEIGVGRGAMSRLLRDLEDRDYLARRPSGTDGRATTVLLTNRGESVYQHVLDPLRSTLAQRMARLSESQQVQLRLLLDLIANSDETAW